MAACLLPITITPQIKRTINPSFSQATGQQRAISCYVGNPPCLFLIFVFDINKKKDNLFIPVNYQLKQNKMFFP